MVKIKLNLSICSFFTLVLPLIALISSILIFLAYAFFPPVANNYLAEAALGDGRLKLDEKLAFFNNKKIVVPFQALKELESLTGTDVLSAQTEINQEKWIEVDLTRQKLYAHRNGHIDYEFSISSGKWAPTPTGEFRIWAKLKYTLMHGGSRHDNTYYYLPNVPYTQYFYKGFAFHGTYWHNNFGHPMSHGCINLYTPDAEKLFYWTSPLMPEDQWVVYPSADEPGTKVIIHGQPPQEN